MENNTANMTYLVQLTPLGNYYFGSENTFSTTDKAKGGEQITNYLVRSRRYPQQTTLLGITRYALLLKEDALNKIPATKGELIGEKSFQGLEDKAPETWGKIISISPLFMRKEKDNYIVAGQDTQYYEDEKTKEKVEHLVSLQPIAHPKTTSDFYTASDALSRFKNYDAKQNAQLLWKNAAGIGKPLKQDEIFTETSQVGIAKDFEGRSDDDAFYRQFFYRLQSGFSFAFYLHTTGPVLNANKPLILPAGADQSLFRMTMKEEKNAIFPKEETLPDNAKITLLSDAYISPEILNGCYLVITSGVDFRYIKTTVNTSRYYNMSRQEEGPPGKDMQKSVKLNLLERGSVLYTENPLALIKDLLAPTAYRNAGFNYFSIQSAS